VDAIKIVFDGGPLTRGGSSFAQMTPEVMRAIIQEAHEQRLRVTVHTWREKDALAAIEAGADGLEHGVAAEVVDDDRLCQLLTERDAFYVGTLGILRALGQDLLDNGKRNLKRVADSGGKIALGTDTFTSDEIKGLEPGLNTLQELARMADAGLTAVQIVQAATCNAAEHLGLLAELGTVEKGKIADLLIIDGDPIADISALRIDKVIQRGRVVVGE
jgi:imidazolonepropionase-like amidohydrolase